MKLNKDLVYITIIVGLIALSAQFYYSFHVEPVIQTIISQPKKDVNVYYNKDIQANQEVIDKIQEADKFVYFAIYTFSRSDIKDALLGAKHRGLEIKGVLDKDQTKSVKEQGQIVAELQNAGIPIAFQTHSAIMHMKLLVTDKAYISGSYNWTNNATDKNDEVIEVGTDDSIRKQYFKVIEELFQNYPPQ